MISNELSRDTSLKNESDVSLADFAAIGGMTEAQYSRKLFDKLEAGQLLDLLKLESQVKVADWIGEKFLDNQNEFLVIFQLSMNRVRNVALFCVCSMNMKEEEAKIYVRHAIPGFLDNPPKEVKNCIEQIVLNFDDIEPRI